MKNILIVFVLSVVAVFTIMGQSQAVLISNSGSSSGTASSAKAKVVARKAADTTSYPYDGGRVRFLANQEETGALWSLIEIVEPAGYKTPLHRHPEMDEAFYVVEGVLTVKIGDAKTREFGPGSFVLVPRGTVHAQGNFGKVPVKILVTVLPGGFEQFFEDRVELFKKTPTSDPEFEAKIKAVIARNNIEVLGPWEP